MADWSEIYSDLLHRIFEELSVPDILRSAAVCSAWHAAFRDFRRRRHELRRQSPWMLLSCRDAADRPPAANFFSPSEKKLYTIYLPGITGQHVCLGQESSSSSSHGRVCIGSSHGWLITASITNNIDRCRDMQLLNPVTGAQIDLPPHRIISRRLYSTCLRAVLSSNPSSGDYAVLLLRIHCRVKQIYFVRAGDKTWTVLSTPDKGYMDVIFYRGRIYALTRIGELNVWDLASSSSSSVAPSLIIGPELDDGISAWRKYFNFRHLAEAPSGDLLQIADSKIPSTAAAARFSNGARKIVAVIKVDLEGKRLVEMDNLGDHAILLVYSHSLCLSSCHLSEFEFSPNHAYFLEKNRKQQLRICSYNLQDGRRSNYLSLSSELKLSPFIWFTPSFV